MSEANLNLTVGCLIQTFPIDALFKVKVSSHELVDDLKEHILHTLSGHLERTPHRTSLRLRKFYPYQIPDAEYLEDVTDMSSLRYLPSYQKLSSVFGEPPPMDDQPLHVVLEVAQPDILEPLRPDMITLRCLLRGALYGDAFSVTISKHRAIADLKVAIQNERPSSLTGVESMRIHLYPVCVAGDDVMLCEEFGKLGVSIKELEPPTQRIGKFFSKFPTMQMQGYIHIVIAVDSPGIPLTNSAHGIMIQRKNHFASVPSAPPSTTAGVREFRVRQYNSKTPLDCMRGPAHVTPVLPATLLHPVFGEFIDDCKPPDSRESLEPKITHADISLAQMLRETMCKIYGDEKDRATAIRGVFKANRIYFIPSVVSEGHSYQTDGDIVADGHQYAILEVKNEIGTGHSDPLIQAAHYYEESNREFIGETTSVLPCLLVLAYGSHLTFAAAAWNVCPTIEIIGSLCLDYHPTNKDYALSVVHHLFAMKKALRTLASYYMTPLPVSPSMHIYPYPTSYSLPESYPIATPYPVATPNRRKQDFVYKNQWAEHTMYTGSLSDDEDLKICIKFSHSYSKEAHESCAAKGHAPLLLGHQRMPGGWHMVIMEQLSSNFVEFHRYHFPADFSKEMLVSKIRSTIVELHNDGFVHGDLRHTNILVDTQNPHGFMIVDWDWSGKNGSVKYPVDLNRDGVSRPEGAIGGHWIRPEHDTEMLKFLLESSTSIGHKRPTTSDASQRAGKLQRVF